MDDHGYSKASLEYESKLFDGPPLSEEELEKQIEEKEYWEDFYTDIKIEQSRLER